MNLFDEVGLKFLSNDELLDSLNHEFPNVKWYGHGDKFVFRFYPDVEAKQNSFLSAEQHSMLYFTRSNFGDKYVHNYYRSYNKEFKTIDKLYGFVDKALRSNQNATM